MPTHQSAASAINLVDEENEQAPRPIEAEVLPNNMMDDAVMHVIARVEQTFGAWCLSAANQDRHVSADRLQLAAQHDRWRAAECYLLSMRWFSLEEERVMQQSSVSISLSF